MAGLSSRASKCRWYVTIRRKTTIARGGIGSRGMLFILLGLFWVMLLATTAYSQFMPPIPNQPQQQGRNIGQFPPQVGPQGMIPGRGQPPRGSAEQLPKIEASGTIEALTPMGLQIATPSGQKWQLVLARECKFELIGKALPDVLRPGVIVSFTASIEKKTGHATEKIESLVVCSIDQNHQLGVFPDQGVGGVGGEGAAFGEMGGAGPAGNGFGAAAGGFGNLGGPAERPTRPGRTRHTPQDDVPIERYQVCGRISAITKLGLVTVVAPNPHFRAPIQIEVGENPDISLELSGREAMSFVRPGAKVTGKGVQIGPTAARMSELTVELTEPLTFAPPKKEKEQAGEQDRPHPRSGARPPANRPAEDKPSEGETTEKPAQETNSGAKAEQTVPADQNAPPKAAGIELPPLP